MFLRRILRVTSIARRFGDEYENVFKTYLHQAEEIEKHAQEKAKAEIEAIGKSIRTSKPSSDIYEGLLNNLNTKSKLITSINAEQMQVVIEEALLQANIQYKSTKDTQSDPITPGKIIEKLMIYWNSTPEIKIKEITLVSLLRTIWVSPYTKTSEDFGSFKRLVKDIEVPHSPFYFGPLSDQIYCDLVRSVGTDKLGVRVLRKIIDHIAVNQYTPSPELAELLIEEAINGKWPRLLQSIIGYLQTKDTNIQKHVWVSCINFFRYNKDLFVYGNKIIDIALKKNVAADWDLIQSYVTKFNKHMMFNESEILVKKIKDHLAKQFKNKEERSEKLCEVTSKYLKSLSLVKGDAVAAEHLNQFMVTEHNNPAAVEVGMKYLEELNDPMKALVFFKNVTSKETFIYTPKFIVSAMRMVAFMGKPGIGIVNTVKDKILVETELSSPFALNIIIAAYAHAEEWGQLQDLLIKAIAANLNFNKYTMPTINKVLEKCLDPTKKLQIKELGVKIDEKIPKV